MADSENGCESALITEVSPLISSDKPNTMIATSGSSFSTVVTTCTAPISRVPRQFRYVSNQMMAHEAIAGPPVVVLIQGMSSARYATVASAIAALPTHTPIQYPQAMRKPTPSPNATRAKTYGPPA